MRFLRIENRAEFIPSFELFTLLGASDSYGNRARIGQFGSGFSHTLALFARHPGILERCKFCLGNDVYTASLKTHSLKNSTGDIINKNEIIIKKQNGGTVNTNITSDFGRVNWTNIGMGVREIISNAIDGSEAYCGNASTVKIEIVGKNECRAKEQLIRIYIPITEEIEEYYISLYKNFRCLSAVYDEKVRVIPNKNQEPVRVYRKGVVVYTSQQKSLFHYEYPDIEINECRLVDSSTATDRSCNMLIQNGTVEQIATFMKEVLIEGNKDLFEYRFGSYDFNPSYQYQSSQNSREIMRKKIKDAFHSLYGDKGVLCKDNMTALFVTEKGFIPVMLNQTGFYECLQLSGITTYDKILNADEAEGKTVVEATPSIEAAVDKVWGRIVSMNFHMGKDKPGVLCFTSHMDGGAMVDGKHYFRDNKIYIHSDYSGGDSVALWAVIIEELAHYITGSGDKTRDLQDYAFRLSATLMLA